MTNLIFRNGLFDYLCSNCDMTLHLILKTCWYNMITQGIKREEYRENKPYWKKRLFSHKYTHVCFHRAYTNETMTYKIESISIAYVDKSNVLRNLDAMQRETLIQVSIFKYG